MNADETRIRRGAFGNQRFICIHPRLYSGLPNHASTVVLARQAGEIIPHPMKVLCVSLSFLVSPLVVAATAQTQEPLPIEQVREFARRLTDGTAAIPDAPVKVETDPERPQSLRWEGGSVMVVPDKSLSAAALAEASDALVPIGRLLLRNTVLITDGAPVPTERIRRVTVGGSDGGFQIPLLLLAAKKNAEGRLDLLVLSQDAEPLARAPLGKVAQPGKFPIELSVEKDESGGPGTLTLNIAGQYEAELAVRRGETR